MPFPLPGCVSSSHAHGLPPISPGSEEGLEPLCLGQFQLGLSRTLSLRLCPLCCPLVMPTVSSQPCTCTNLLKLMRFALERTWLMETVLTGLSPEREREMLEEEQERCQS